MHRALRLAGRARRVHLHRHRRRVERQRRVVHLAPEMRGMHVGRRARQQYAVGQLQIGLVIGDAAGRQQQWQAATAGMNADSQRSLLVAQETYATVQAEMSGIRAESALYQPKAPFAGWIRDLDPDLRLSSKPWSALCCRASL